jgi:6-pyruvoyltetrahydropterin/6-carboxytetrahydropterin synthase
MKYQSTKTYGHEEGLSCAFRQWRASSHCSLIHGYPLSFKFVFGCDELDERGWCVDFGALKPLKAALHTMFDHTLAVAGDDPMLAEFNHLNNMGIASVVIFPDGVGCEKFARSAFGLAQVVIENKYGVGHRVHVVSCECAEHGANSAIYYGDN